MKNYVQDGNSIQLAAPVGGVVGGQVFEQGELVGVVVASAAEGELFTLMLEGVYSDLPKAAEALAVGEKVYWSAENSNFTKTAAGNSPAGYAFVAALAGDTTATIKLSR